MSSLFFNAVGLLVERDDKYGGNVKYVAYEEMEVAYAKEVSCVVLLFTKVLYSTLLRQSIHWT